MEENKKENERIIEEGAVVINEKDIINPEEVKEEETIEVVAEEVIIEKEEVTSTGETKEDMKSESKEAPAIKKITELVAKVIYEDKLLKINIVEGKVIKEVYEQKGVKLTEARKKELIKAGVAELKEIIKE